MRTRVWSTTWTSQSRWPLKVPVRRVELRRIADHEGQTAALRRNVTDLDPRATAELGHDLIFHLLEAVLGEVGLIRLQQQLATAREVETEVDRRARQPLGIFGLEVGRQHARNSEKYADQDDQRDRPDLPARKIEH